ncbi:MAG: sulfur carrier protein ThiS [Planctomycetota bacterium]|nr:sulfur carrier protein ThiS [Planctomycetota bacterium]
MTVTVNGLPVTLHDGATLRHLIEHLDLADAPCAAEVNKSLVPHRRHASHELRDGDVVEVVTLVGGG